MMNFLSFFVLFPSVDILTPKKLLLLRDFLQTDLLYVKLREMSSRSLSI